MNADPIVMADLGGPLGRADSDAKLERFERAFEQHGIGRWVVESLADASFLGYVGIMRHGDDHALGAHADLGWRLCRAAWGQGHATAGAGLALTDAFDRVHLDEVLAYTAPDNVRSQAVMNRLGLRRDAIRDFTDTYPDTGPWRGLVWVATRPDNATTD